ncbi:MAG TPA: hypothetical protein VLJ59_08365 [Mycobacteriales bacterium]|nr:hypothetical protein [Mycobacteriales bacterium]
MLEPYASVVDVLLILTRGDQVLLALREGTGYADVRLTSTVHYRNPAEEARIGFFFHVVSNPAGQGEPVNAEPHKCAKIGWCPLDMLPENTVPYTVAGIGLYQAGDTLGVVGWNERETTPSGRVRRELLDLSDSAGL